MFLCSRELLEGGVRVSYGLESLNFLTCSFNLSGPDPTKNYITIMAALNHTFSRGFAVCTYIFFFDFSVTYTNSIQHAKSNNPQEQPRIDPRYFEDDFGELSVLLSSTSSVN